MLSELTACASWTSREWHREITLSYEPTMTSPPHSPCHLFLSSEIASAEKMTFNVMFFPKSAVATQHFSDMVTG